MIQYWFPAVLRSSDGSYFSYYWADNKKSKATEKRKESMEEYLCSSTKIRNFKNKLIIHAELGVWSRLLPLPARAGSRATGRLKQGKKCGVQLNPLSTKCLKSLPKTQTTRKKTLQYLWIKIKHIWTLFQLCSNVAIRNVNWSSLRKETFIFNSFTILICKRDKKNMGEILIYDYLYNWELVLSSGKVWNFEMKICWKPN